MEMKQSQTIFHGTSSNMTSFPILPKILNYFNNFQIEISRFYNQSEPKHGNKTKLNTIWMTFEIYFLIRFIPKMTNNSDGGKMFFI